MLMIGVFFNVDKIKIGKKKVGAGLKGSAIA